MSQDLKVAYILRRFPSLTETFIMREMYWIREHHISLHIFTLFPPDSRHPAHDQTEALIPNRRYTPFFSWDVLKAQFSFLKRSPKRYFQALSKAIWQSYREPMVLLRVLALFPKSVCMAQQMESMQIQHIHAHFVWIEGLVAGIITDLLGITFSIHPHAFGLFRRNQQNVRRELENASQIITISTYNRAYIAALSSKIAADDIAIVHCGLEADRLVPTSKPDNGAVPSILSVGRLIEKKGHAYLVQACALLAERGLEFECQIVGDGALENELQTMIDEHGLQNQVKLLGALGQNEVLALYQESDIFALPCVTARNGDKDGIPVVLMEAMACELPVVTTPLTGIPDLVQDRETGLFVAERDASGLAEALSDLMADKALRQRLGKQARQTVLKDFEIRGTAEKMATIFRQVVEAKEKAIS